MNAALPYLSGAVVVCVAFQSGRLAGWGPFAIPDVAIVQVLTAFPLAALIANLLARKLSRLTSLGLAAVVFLISLAAMLTQESLRGIDAAHISWLAAALLRFLIATGLALSAAIVGVAFLATGRSVPDFPAGRRQMKMMALALFVATVPAATYVSARCQHDANHLAELLQQSRLGEARQLVRSMLVLHPQAHLDSGALADLAVRVEQTVWEIEQQLAVALPRQASDEDRLQRARALAMLGNAESAMQTIQGLRDPAALAAAFNLIGAICENQQDWRAGLEAYQHANTVLRKLPAASQRTASQTTAAAGTAYCLRKLGRYDEAEASYRHLLELAPTADTHFLLAQFYEDRQWTRVASIHARRAMALAPEQYQQKGQRLIDKMTVYHFGCLGAGK